jgi:hypothetical protein
MRARMRPIAETAQRTNGERGCTFREAAVNWGERETDAIGSTQRAGGGVYKRCVRLQRPDGCWRSSRRFMDQPKPHAAVTSPGGLGAVGHPYTSFWTEQRRIERFEEVA